jgi:hypothetical protein
MWHPDFDVDPSSLCVILFGLPLTERQGGIHGGAQAWVKRSDQPAEPHPPNRGSAALSHARQTRGRSRFPMVRVWAMPVYRAVYTLP